MVYFVANLRSLTVLNLNNNAITNLPSDISKLISLEKLSLDGNHLRTLPIELCALKNLLELRIANNRLERLPLELGFLSRLEELHVPLNKLRELPEVGKGFLLNTATRATHWTSTIPSTPIAQLDRKIILVLCCVC